MQAAQQERNQQSGDWFTRNAATLLNAGLLLVAAGVATIVYLQLTARSGWILPAVAAMAVGLLLIVPAAWRLHGVVRGVSAALAEAQGDAQERHRALRRRLAGETAERQTIEELQRALMLAIEQPVLLIEAGGRIVDANQAALVLLDYPRAALLNLPLAHVIRGQLRPAAGRRIAVTLLDRQRGERALEGTLARITRNGDALYVLALNSAPPAAPPVEPAAVEAEPVAAEAPDVDAIAVHNAFLATVGHDLRAPLNAVLGLSEALLADAYGALEPPQVRPVEMIRASGETLTQLIDSVVDLAKYETDALSVRPNPAALRPICQAAADLVHAQATRREITVALAFPYALPAVQVDERRLRHFLTYWLIDALSHTPDGGRLELQALANAATQAVTLTTHIVGVGELAADRYGAARRRLIARLATAAGVQFEPMSDRPYRAHATLPPAGPVAPAIRPTPGRSDSDRRMAAPPTIQGAADGPLILLAEDNAINIETLVDFLAFKGYRVLPVRDGRQALEQAALVTPALILMDIQMPNLNGLEAIRLLRMRPATRSTPIIAVTGLAAVGDRERCLAAGANDYLSKPFQLDMLVSIIETLLASAA